MELLGMILLMCEINLRNGLRITVDVLRCA